VLRLISITGVKHLPAVLAEKNSATNPIFLHGFRRAPSDLQLCFAQLKTCIICEIFHLQVYRDL